MEVLKIPNGKVANSINKNSEDAESILKNKSPLLINIVSSAENEENPNVLNHSDESESVRLGDLSKTVFNSVGATSAPTAPNPSAGATGAQTSDSFNPVDVWDIYGLMNASRDTFDWKKYGLPDLGIGMTDEQKQFLYYKTDYLEVSAKDRQKPVDLNAIAAQLADPSSRLSKYVVESGKAIAKAGGRVTGDRSLGNLAKALKAIASSKDDIFKIAAQGGDGDMIEASDLNTSIPTINFPGVDESKQSEMNELRKNFFEYIRPFLRINHQLPQIMKTLDEYILSAINNGPKTGSLNGKIITYYSEKGELSSSLAVYSDSSKRPSDFFQKINEYFSSMMEKAGKPAETPI